MLLVAVCALFILSAWPAAAQVQSDQTSLTIPYRHFSWASNFANHPAIAIAEATTDSADPVPIPGGLAPHVHIFAPGPTRLGFQGLDVEPSGITNFNGFSALAYLSGTAVDSKSNTYNLSSDMRLYRGEYIAADGTHHRGTFVFIWIDLFDPSSGAQVHDFNGHIFQSGLFWIVQVPDEAYSVGEDQTVHIHLTEEAVIDNLVIFGPGTKYANATIDISWKPVGEVRHYRPGSTNPTDPSFFAGSFRNAIARADFTVLLKGVTFTVRGASSNGVFAEMGHERNGLFIEP